MPRSQTAPQAPAPSALQLQSAADSAVAADQAEAEVARQQVKTQGLSGREAQTFLLARWVERVNPFLRALADKTRLSIVGVLAEREPMEVGVLAKELKVRSSTMSQHLAILRDARVIVMTKAGVRTLCSVNGPYVAWRLQQVAQHLGEDRQ